MISPVDGQQERRLDWEVVDATGPEAIVEVQVGGPPCDVVTGLDVTEDPEEVTLTIWAGRETARRLLRVPSDRGHLSRGGATGRAARYQDAQPPMTQFAGRTPR